MKEIQKRNSQLTNISKSPFTQSFFLPGILILLISSWGLKSWSLPSSEEPVESSFLLLADQLEYKTLEDCFDAQGSLHLFFQEYYGEASFLRYERTQDRFWLRGNFWIRTPEGIFLFGQEGVFTHRMRRGRLRQIQVLLQDHSRAAAAAGEQQDNERLVLHKGVYSPCHVCRLSDSFPLWQLRANEIIHDQRHKILTYHHAFMDIYGFPVLYTPYFSHPDPSVKRKSGLLTPIYGRSSSLGTFLMQPYFWAIDHDRDLTLTPLYTSSRSLALGSEYRQVWSQSTLTLNSSYANSSHSLNADQNNPYHFSLPQSNRWHIFADGKHHFSNDTLMTLKIRRASDETYLKRYPLPLSCPRLEIQNILTSSASLERSRPTTYSQVRGYFFQSDASKNTNPLVLPQGSHSFESLPGQWNETYGGDINLLHTSRREEVPGQRSKRMTRGGSQVFGQVPYVTSGGHFWQVKGLVQSDLYWVQGFHSPRGPFPQQTQKTRVFPQGSLTWKYPLLHRGRGYDWSLEPKIMVIGGPSSPATEETPNEDSAYVGVTPLTLYAMSRFSGRDRLDLGSRLVYGLQSRHSFEKDRELTLWMGQTKRLNARTSLPFSSAEDKKDSGFVGAVHCTMIKQLSLESQFFLDRNRYQIQWAESGASLNTLWGTARVGHIFYRSLYSSNQAPHSSLVSSLKTAAYRNITLEYSEIRDFSQKPPIHLSQPNLLSQSIALVHHNECLISTLTVSRSFFQDRDVKANTQILLSFDFKNLGVFAPLSVASLGGGSPE